MVKLFLWVFSPRFLAFDTGDEPWQIARNVMTAEELYDEANGEVALGNLEDALALYRQAVEANPEFIDGWQALAMACLKTNRPKEAVEAAKMAVHLDPDTQVTWTTLSLAYNKDGNVEKAEMAGAKAKVLSWGGKIAREGARFPLEEL
ncbi:tetratricopeptide repeat protein [Oscillatoria amoena NRMC-F 0135]|nr:tetratricopeptide repeat protein [Oscillatoria amoena NRMC-F 0135]MDL5054524.1 tetratricopeptide repeat protein [Oscillatoria laete-virens NRMC-F 0139]